MDDKLVVGNKCKPADNIHVLLHTLQEDSRKRKITETKMFKQVSSGR